jgi:dimeric dUTPase (all-alpha-NTP-PPase superfamily)
MNDSSPLHEMFRLQRDLNVRVGCPLDRELSPEEKELWILRFSRAELHELVELEDDTNWKWWRPAKELDFQNMRVEVVDKFHFLISQAQVLGMSADDVFEAYLKKNKVNHERQDTGYVVKDPNDCRHI